MPYRRETTLRPSHEVPATYWVGICIRNRWTADLLRRRLSKAGWWGLSGVLGAVVSMAAFVASIASCTCVEVGPSPPTLSFYDVSLTLLGVGLIVGFVVGIASVAVESGALEGDCASAQGNSGAHAPKLNCDGRLPTLCRQTCRDWAAQDSMSDGEKVSHKIRRET